MVLRQADEITMSAANPAASAVLFGELVRPVLAALRGTSRVTVAPDAPYFAASFAGLWNPERRRFWIEDVEIAVTSKIGSSDSLEATAPSAIIEVAEVATADGATGTWKKAPPQALIQLPALAASNNHLPQLSRIVLADAPGRPYSGTWLARDLVDLPRVRGVLLPNIDPGEQPVFGAGSYDVASAFLEAGVTSHVVSTIAPTAVGGALAGGLRQRLEGTPSVVSAVAAFQRDVVHASGQRLGPWSRIVVYGSGR
jgi:hypothetical protein